MADYTKRNLKTEVEDFAPKFGLAPDMEYRPAREPLEGEQSAVSYLRLAPGFRMPFGHHHKEQEEIYVLLSGSATLNLDGEKVELVPLDVTRIAAPTIRALEAGPGGLRAAALRRAERRPGRRRDARRLVGLTT